MVDYTKPAYRDAQWNIWKGGQKLIDQLTAQYTNARVYKRLSAANPMGPKQPATGGCQGCAMRRMRLKSRLAAFTLNRGAGGSMLRKQLRAVNAQIREAKK